MSNELFLNLSKGYVVVVNHIYSNARRIILYILSLFAVMFFQGCSDVCIGPFCIDEDGKFTTIVHVLKCKDCEECDVSGARDLKPEHQKILVDAGWYEYVHNHLDRIEYKDVKLLDHSSPAIGLAHCEGGSKCYIEVATKDRMDIDIVRTIVHEAAHLEDNCENGEEPAIKAQEQFLKDYENYKNDS